VHAIEPYHRANQQHLATVDVYHGAEHDRSEWLLRYSTF